MITTIIILTSISTAVQADHICFGELGCFYSTTGLLTLLNSILIPIPESPEKINTRFELRTRSNGPGFQVIKATDVSSVRDSSFDPEKAIKFLIHGFNPGTGITWPSEVSQEILAVEDVNCFAVYWEDGAAILYEQAVSNARVVGAQVAYFLTFLQTMYKRLFNVHIIGHSLGAHVAGFAGQRASPRVQRISGLDPAGPLFEGAKNDMKLDASDAELVDVIYTDSATFTSLLMLRGFATNDVSGHLNVYPNGGRNQPGCDESPLLYILDLSKFIDTATCSHFRSLHLYRESIQNPTAFLAHPASSYKEFQNGAGSPCNGQCVWMGYFLNSAPSNTGKFYLYTRGESPFSAGCE
ncbi:inactive pancreatic lipase-related protein 1-like [Anomaloglossus baeobatrachus]|uniref:inactive pancreatic lipase-related protein 1-like n=1 Tax=Anomaloglossus baeobatrachus TaxID=238106 RepID=UPI003F4F564E